MGIPGSDIQALEEQDRTVNRVAYPTNQVFRFELNGNLTRLSSAQGTRYRMPDVAPMCGSDRPKTVIHKTRRQRIVVDHA
jgi:hypothetical protein